MLLCLYIVCFIVSALKHLIKMVLERLMDTVVSVDDDEEEEAEQTSAQLHKTVHCSLSTLCDWYNSKRKVGPRSSAGVPDFTFKIGRRKRV